MPFIVKTKKSKIKKDDEKEIGGIREDLRDLL
jgi:hypothetical protein